VVNENDEDAAVRREDEETAAETAESLLAFENAALPLMVVLPTGRVAMANRATRALLGYRFDDMVGSTLFELFGTAPSEWRERVDTGPPVTSEHRTSMPRRDGVEIDVWASSLLVTDGTGTVRYVLVKAVPDPR
jgi:PAS domain S-box-containing protein